MKTTQQALMVGSGLMIAVGFMFGIVANLSSLTPDSGPSNSNNQQEINAELPNNTYSEQDYGLGANEQAYLSVNNEVVFVNALYNDNTTEFDIEGLNEDFNNRVYVNKVEASESTLNSQLQISQYPSVVVIGDQPTQQRGFTLNRVENDRESLNQAVCGAMRNVGDAAATCY